MKRNLKQFSTLKTCLAKRKKEVFLPPKREISTNNPMFQQPKSQLWMQLLEINNATVASKTKRDQERDRFVEVEVKRCTSEWESEWWVSVTDTIPHI